MDIETRVWEFLPARPDRRRVTTPDVIAIHTGVTTQQAADALKSLERAGRIVRDAKLGSRTGWHRASASTRDADPHAGGSLFGDPA